MATMYRTGIMEYVGDERVARMSPANGCENFRVESSACVNRALSTGENRTVNNKRWTKERDTFEHYLGWTWSTLSVIMLEKNLRKDVI